MSSVQLRQTVAFPIRTGLDMSANSQSSFSAAFISWLEITGRARDSASAAQRNLAAAHPQLTQLSRKHKQLQQKRPEMTQLSLFSGQLQHLRIPGRTKWADHQASPRLDRRDERGLRPPVPLHTGSIPR